MGRDLTFFHVSDLHFGVKGGKESFLPEVGKAVHRAAEELCPDALLVSGDLTTNALREEFLPARDYLASFSAEHKLVVPGNHDARGPHGLSTFRELIGVSEPSLKLPGAMIVGVDSTEEDAESRRKGRLTERSFRKALKMSKGFAGPEQYPRIRKELRRAEPGDLKVIVMHHHLVGIPGVGIDTDPLLDSGDLLDLFLDEGVHLVLSGHKHRPWLWKVNGLLILHSGTSTSRRYKGGIDDNYYNVVRLTGKILTLDRVRVRGGQSERVYEGRVDAADRASPRLSP